MSAKAYLEKAMDGEDLDTSIEYTLKALKRDPDYKPALNWKEILQINVENKIQNLQNIKDGFLKEIRQKEFALQKIRNIQQDLKNRIEDIKNSRILLMVKYTSLSTIFKRNRQVGNKLLFSIYS